MKLTEKEKFIGVGLLIIVVGIIVAIIVINFPDNSSNQSSQPSNIIGKIIQNIDKRVSEKKELLIKNNYCGDGFCDIGENCQTCSQDCGKCSENTCGNGICTLDKCKTCSQDCSLIQCENGICEPNKEENCVSTPNDCKCPTGNICDINLKKCIEVSDAYVAEQNIQKISESPDENYPIIFIHGHSPWNEETSGAYLNAFKSVEDKMITDSFAIKGPIIFPGDNLNNYKEGLISNTGKPLTIKTTYYTKIISSDNVYVGDSDTSSIRVYGSRLSNVIDIVLKITKKNKVNIIAHSMGGLVAREYIKQSGGSKVNKLIMIGTPNHGIWKSDNPLLAGCSTGHKGEECDDMQHDSSFLNNLNNEEIVGNVKVYTIVGWCGGSVVGEHWDNVIRVSSVRINGAKENYLITCNDATKYSFSNNFHSAMLNPDEVPEAYNKIIEFLKA